MFNLKSQSSLTKEALRNILSLAQSTREKELVKHTAFVAGNFSQTSARETLGLEEMNRKAAEVERCIAEAKEIREAIERIAKDETQSMLLFDSDSEHESDDREPTLLTHETENYLMKLCKKTTLIGLSYSLTLKVVRFQTLLETFLGNHGDHEFSQNEVNQIEQWYFAFKSDE